MVPLSTSDVISARTRRASLTVGLVSETASNGASQPSICLRSGGCSSSHRSIRPGAASASASWIG